LNNHAAVMDGIVGKENRLQHFRRRQAANGDAGLDGILQLNGLLDGDERADADIGQAFRRLDDDFDVFTLVAARISEAGDCPVRPADGATPAENDEHREGGEGKKPRRIQPSTSKRRRVASNVRTIKTKNPAMTGAPRVRRRKLTA